MQKKIKVKKKKNEKQSRRKRQTISSDLMTRYEISQFHVNEGEEAKESLPWEARQSFSRNYILKEDFLHNLTRSIIVSLFK